MMEPYISNLKELRAEIIRKQILAEQQQASLKIRFQSPSAVFASALTLFPKSSTVDGIRSSSLFKQDFFGLISRFLLPMILNKTLFRHSNFLIKGLIIVLSQKASRYINEESVTSIWSKIRSIFNKDSTDDQATISVQPVVLAHYDHVS